MTNATRGELPVELLHLFVLWGFAVAQPLFDLFGQYPTFLIAHDVASTEIAALAALLSFAIPGAICALQWCIGLFCRVCRRATHLGWVGVLSAAMVMPLLSRLSAVPDWAMVTAAALLGLGVTVAYARARGMRLFLTWLGPSVVVFPVWFLVAEPVATLTWPKSIEIPHHPNIKRDRPPVVFLLFDEFPVTALTRPGGHIDARRFPNFARLAATSQWYRNTTTLDWQTPIAVPALLSGSRPNVGEGEKPPPVAEQYPLNLFTLLADGYELYATEPITGLCPESICTVLPEQNSRSGLDLRFLADSLVVYAHRVLPPGLRQQLPQTDKTWAGFSLPASDRSSVHAAGRQFADDMQRGRTSGLEALLAAIVPREKPALYFMHATLPHAPYEYLPSGKRYASVGVGETRRSVHPLTGKLSLLADTWSDDPVRSAVTYEQFLNQVGFVDTLLGRVIARLIEQELFDKALLVVTSDHGVTIRPGEMRRMLTPSNYKDVLGVPLFIKAPYQSHGHIDDRNVELIDIVPTILDLLGLPIPRELEGISLVDPDAAERDNKVVFMRGKPIEYPADLALFNDYPNVAPEATRPWRVELFPGGLDQRLIGRPVPVFAHDGDETAQWLVEIRDAGAFQQVDLRSPFLPAQLMGRLVRTGSGSDAQGAARHTVAIALNGTVQAVTKTYRQDESPYLFSAMLPEAAFQNGNNELSVFLVKSRPGAAPLLVPLPLRQPVFELKFSAGQGEMLVGPDQRVLPVRPLGQTSVIGFLDTVQCQGTWALYQGWAIDELWEHPITSIAVFVDGRFLVASGPNVQRVDLAKHLGNPSFEWAGFKLRSRSDFLRQSRAPDIRVFGLTRDHATELPHAPKLALTGCPEPAPILTPTFMLKRNAANGEKLVGE